MKNSIKINGSIKSCQTKQVNDNSIQMIKIGNSNVFNYNKVLDVLLSIQKSSNSDEFASDFGNNAEEIKLIINDTIEMVERKDTPTKIKISLEKIKVFAHGVTESIVATGICKAIVKALN